VVLIAAVYHWDQFDEPIYGVAVALHRESQGKPRSGRRHIRQIRHIRRRGERRPIGCYASGLGLMHENSRW
jgi:hypothetical protein